jgi:hypothetical protein
MAGGGDWIAEVVKDVEEADQAVPAVRIIVSPRSLGRNQFAPIRLPQQMAYSAPLATTTPPTVDSIENRRGANLHVAGLDDRAIDAAAS